MTSSFWPFMLAVVAIALTGCGRETPTPTPTPGTPGWDTAPDYGYPQCYTAFTDGFDTFENDIAHYEVRPLSGFARMPYTIGTAEECAALQLPLVSIGPHWSPLGVTIYSPVANASRALPGLTGQVLVASHGSWNRDPWIGYSVNAYDIDLAGATPTYTVRGQSMLVPPLRETAAGMTGRLRPVDLATNPVDGSLLMTTDHDDFAGANRGGGLYRIASGLVTPSPNGELVPLPNSGSILGGDAKLERLVNLTCARQIAISEKNPYLLYVSSLTLLCPEQPNGAIYVVELDPDSGGVLRSATLISGLHHPQGIDVGRAVVGDDSLYIATGGDSEDSRGNCVIKLTTADDVAFARLDGSIAAPLDPFDERLVDVSCGFTRVQGQHFWRSVRVAPSGGSAIVSIGADCNWPCESSPAPHELQTTLVSVDLNSGSVAVAAKGVRNSIGLHFTPNGDLLFTGFGSDLGDGIPDGGNGQNVPDCELNVLRLPSESIQHV